MTTEHKYMERAAAALDENADDIFCRIANGEFTNEGKAEADAEAQAYRRCAEIIRHQIGCEA